MKWLLMAFALVLAVPAWAQTASGPSTAMTPSPDDRAKQWLSLIDDQNYADAYKQMGAGARSKSSEQEFAAKIGGERTPLGAMASRTLKDVNAAKTLPGMRDGQYTIVRFDSSFAHKTAAVESVTLESENGAWSVVNYSIH